MKIWYIFTNFDVLQHYLQQISYNTSFTFGIQYFCSGKKLIQCYNDIGIEKLHILILDMDIGDGSDGLVTAKTIRSFSSSQDVQIIFLSHYMKNILESYEAFPFQWFLKPINYDLFNEKMLSLCNYIFSSMNRLLIIKSDNYQVVLRIRDVIAIVKTKESLSQKRLIVITEQEEYILKFNTQYVIMINQQIYPIGRSKIKLLKETYLSYSFEQGKN
ncbi:hypothetical protein D3C74_224890 [compost metagenome]